MSYLNWIRNFTVTDDDVDYLTNYMLERETPLMADDLARLLIGKRLEEEKNAQSNASQNAQIYNPAETYTLGTRLIYPELDSAVAEVVHIREGDNPAYNSYQVIGVRFDNSQLNKDQGYREFAMALTTPHRLTEAHASGAYVQEEEELPDVATVFRNHENALTRIITNALRNAEGLVRVAGYWFHRDLIIEVDIGTLHLAEAVLDMNGGGPLPTSQIIEEIGGVGNAPIDLQVFSLNLAMKADERFDEVGPAGQILWYLVRMEPQYVREIPAVLDYREIDYDDDVLTDGMIVLETELDDELSPIDFEGQLTEATTTLIYPHRRMGTLPLNAKLRQIFPYAKTPRIHVNFVDTSDNSRFTGWVVHEFRYVYGLSEYYTKHRLPIGAYLTIRKGQKPGEILLSYNGYKPRTEWIRLVTPHKEQLLFENKKRAIGAEYDDLLIVGIDDLEALDKMVGTHRNKSLSQLIRIIINELGKLTPQGTVHAETLYSAVNIIRRCPPGPIFAALRTNPDFEHTGDHYWRLAD